MTIRSVCLISREYPPETAFGGIARVVEMTARNLVDAGVAVHVISLDPGGRAGTHLQDGVVVHRVSPPPIAAMGDMPYLELGAWSQVVADTYRQIDAKVQFDLVHAQDYFAETLHLERRPETPLVVQLHSPCALIHDPATRTAGQQAADALELVALCRADALLAPTKRVLSDVVALVGDRCPPGTVLPPAFDARRFSADPIPHPAAPIRLLFVGRLEPNKGADLALRVLAELRRRGTDAHLTLVGRDVLGAYGSYRRDVLRPLMGEVGLDAGDLRFVEQLDEAGVARHLRAADALVVPSHRENLHTAAVEALAAGVPVICGARTGLTDWFGPADGVIALNTDGAEDFARAAADALEDLDTRRAAARVGAQRVRDLFDPGTAVAEYLAFCDTLVEEPAAPEITPEMAPEMAIVVLAHNALGYTKRTLRSVLQHTATPFQLVVVDNASSDGTSEWIRTLDDPRITLVHSDVNLGVSGGRNAGIDAVAPGVRFISFLDNDVEVFAGWDLPFVDALVANEDVAIAGELGVNLQQTASGERSEQPLIGRRGPIACDMAVGFCMVMQAEAVRLIGSFDEALGLFWHDDDDYAIRAHRLGYRVAHIGSGAVLHFEHRSSATVAGLWDAPSVPSTLSVANQRYLATKWDRQFDGGLAGARAFTTLAFADELSADPELLRAYCATFSEDDAATLVVYAPGADPAVLESELLAAFAAAAVDPATIPDVLALAPTEVTDEDEVALGQQVESVLSERARSAWCSAPPRAGAAEIALLRRVAERVWKENLIKSSIAGS